MQTSHENNAQNSNKVHMRSMKVPMLTWNIPIGTVIVPMLTFFVWIFSIVSMGTLHFELFFLEDIFCSCRTMKVRRNSHENYIFVSIEIMLKIQNNESSHGNWIFSIVPIETLHVELCSLEGTFVPVGTMLKQWKVLWEQWKFQWELSMFSWKLCFNF